MQTEQRLPYVGFNMSLRSAISYVRFSDPSQRKGTSLARQSELIKAYAAEKGWAIEQELLDDGYSGYKGHHRRENAALGGFEIEVENGFHHDKVLIVERLDRLSRQGHTETVNLVQSFLRHGVSVAIVKGDKLYQAGEEIPLTEALTMLIEADADKKESVKKTERLTAGWDIRQNASKKSGKALTKHCPAWLMVDDSRNINIIPNRAALVKRMFELADSGYGSGSIAKRFNEERIKPWGNLNGKVPRIWGRTFIARILASRTVIGEFQPHQMLEGKRVPKGEPWQNHFPVVVEADLFERVHAGAKQRKAFSGGRRSALIGNLFGNIVKCPCCGSTMRYQPAHKEGRHCQQRQVA